MLVCDKLPLYTYHKICLTLEKENSCKLYLIVSWISFCFKKVRKNIFVSEAFLFKSTQYNSFILQGYRAKFHKAERKKHDSYYKNGDKKGEFEKFGEEKSKYKSEDHKKYGGQSKHVRLTQTKILLIPTKSYLIVYIVV